MLYFLALLIGIVAGLRAMTAPAAIAFAAHYGVLDLSGSWLAFLGYRWTPWIFLVLAIGEWVTDQLPTTPSRKVPVQFGTRILMGLATGASRENKPSKPRPEARDDQSAGLLFCPNVSAADVPLSA